MLADADRLQQTVEQVLKAGVAGQRRGLLHRAPVDLAALAGECVETRAARHHLPPRRSTLAARDADGRPARRRRRRRAAHGARQPARQRGEVLAASTVQVTVEVAAPAPDTSWVRVQDQRRRHPASAAASASSTASTASRRAARTVKGTGLGLYIVRSIARQHGGRVFAAQRGRRPRRHLHAGAAAARAASPSADPA